MLGAVKFTGSLLAVAMALLAGCTSLAPERRGEGDVAPVEMIDPEKVAQAILKAATKGARDVTVGVMAKLNTKASTLAPLLADKMSARQAGRQQRDEPPRDPDGTLYRPGGTGRVHGEGADSVS